MSNIEQGILNYEVFLPSTFEIPCSIFVIHYTVKLIRNFNLALVGCAPPHFQLIDNNGKFAYTLQIESASLSGSCRSRSCFSQRTRFWFKSSTRSAFLT